MSTSSERSFIIM
ncbi:UNVERIFIED_CONTAM: hypothetical protein GTU68_037620 [Idotea baltica]|nr:hypothetical protein [Idotea baltica]